jgi:hypothetical protein
MKYKGIPLGAVLTTRLLEAGNAFFARGTMAIAMAGSDMNMGSPELRASTMMQAQEEFRVKGLNPDSMECKLRGAELFDNERIGLSEDGRRAYTDARSDAFDASFRGPPRRWIGDAAKRMGEFANEYPLFKGTVMPFTNIVASIFNAAVDFTPYPFIFDSTGEHKLGVISKFGLAGRIFRGEATPAEKRTSVAAVTGTMAMAAVYALAQKYKEDDDPYFAIYGKGPSSAGERAVWLARGGKENTIKFGNSYVNYGWSPASIALGVIGRLEDQRREGKLSWDNVGSSMASAVLWQMSHASFVAGLSDVLAASDARDPEKAVENLTARTATSFIPNVFKQLDKIFYPTVQEANGMTQHILKDIPFVRNSLNDKLNGFGQPVVRTGGILAPFISMGETGDPVIKFFADNRLSIPGYGHTTKLGDKVMTNEERYNYVKLAGPRAYQEIMRQMPDIQRLPTRMERQQAVNDIFNNIKQDVRDEMLEKKTR